MKSDKAGYGLLSIMMFPLFLITAVALCNPVWIVEEIASTPAILGSTDLVLDSTDKPNVVFIAGNRLVLALRESGTWCLDTLLQNSVSSVSIDLFSSDVPSMVYSEIGAPGEMKYLYFNGSSWQIESIDQIWDANEACLAIDNQDIPTILYMQFVYLNPSIAKTELFLFKRGATEWECDSILSHNSMDEGMVSNIDLDLMAFTDEPRVLYRLFSDSTFTLEYAWPDQMQEYRKWVSLTLAQDPEFENSLDVDPNGRSHCCYRCNSNLYYAVGDTIGFTQEVIDTGDDVAMYKDVQGDSFSIPHIVYDSPGGLQYATKGESGWEFATVGPPYSAIKDPSICLDSAGNPHIVWIDTSTHKVMYAYYFESSSVLF